MNTAIVTVRFIYLKKSYIQVICLTAENENEIPEPPEFSEPVGTLCYPRFPMLSELIAAIKEHTEAIKENSEAIKELSDTIKGHKKPDQQF